MDRTEWPTEGKLADLREGGKVAWTPFGTSCAALSVSLFVVLGTAGMWRRVGLSFREAFMREDLWACLAAAKELLLLFAAVPLAVIVSVVLAGLFQTRFLFMPGLLSLDWARINPFENKRLPALGRMVLSVVLMWSFLLCLAALLWWLLLPDLLMLFNTDDQILVGWFVQVSGFLIPVISTALLVLAGPAWLLARFRFMLHNRMTRAELEADARES